MQNNETQGRNAGQVPSGHPAEGNGVRSGAALLPPSAPGLRVERLLGVGPQSAVWLVADAAGLHALKVPLPEAQGMLYGSFGSRRELNVQFRLQHENLLRVHAVVETSAGPGLLMDYAPGGNLGALVAGRGPLSVGECITILVAAAQGLAYLHGQGLTHGNLSPSNLLFAADGRPVLADAGSGHLFGNGKRAAVRTAEVAVDVTAEATTEHSGGRHLSLGQQDGTVSMHPPGPPPPPEPAPEPAPVPESGAAEDILSLSALGWYMLTGHVPPEARERPPLAALVPGIGHGLAALIDAGLADDPRARPTAVVLAAEAYRSGPPAPVKLLLPPPVAPAGQQPAGPGRRAPEEPASRRARRRARAGNGNKAAPGTALPAGTLSPPAAGSVPPAAGLTSRAMAGPAGPAGPAGSAVPAGPATPAATGAAVAAGGAGAAGAAPRAVAPSASGPPARRATASGEKKRSRFLLPFGMLLVAATILLAAVLIVAPERLGLPPGKAAADTASTPDPSSTAGDAADKAAADKAAADKAAVDKAAADKAVADKAAADKAAALVALQEQAKSPDPAVAVQGLVGLRATAFRTADSELLNAVNAYGSQAMAADAGELGKLVSAGTMLAGLEVTLDKVALSEQLPPGAPVADGQRISVTVTVTTSAYNETDAAGKIIRTSSEPQSQDAVLVLVGSEGVWKIDSVLPASG